MGPHPARRALLIEQKRAKAKPAPGPAIEQKPTRAGKTLFEPTPARAGVATAASPPAAKPGPAIEPIQPSRPALSAEHRRRNRARTEALTWIRNAYPSLFTYPRKPIAVGIGKVIVAAAIAVGGDNHATRAALNHWVKGHDYLKALAADGAQRHGLDGQPVEPVALEHQVHALDRIAEIEAAKAKRAAALLQTPAS